MFLTKKIKTLLVVGVFALPLSSAERSFFVIADVLNIRSSADKSSSVVGYYGRGEVDRALEIVETDNKKEWVKTPLGYIYKDYVSLFKKLQDHQTLGRVTSDILKLRTAPSVKGLVDGYFSRGDVVKIEGIYKNRENELWAKIDRGFLYLNFLELRDDFVEKQREEEPKIIKEVVQKIQKRTEEKVTIKPQVIKKIKKVQLPIKEVRKKEKAKVEKEKNNSFSLKIAGVSASPKVDKTSTIDLDKRGISLALDLNLKNYNYETLFPTLSLGYSTFPDKEIVIGSVGITKQIVSSGWNFYTTTSLGYGHFQWKEDLLKNSDSKDESSSSATLSLEFGGIYKDSFGLFANYTLADFTTKIMEDGINSEVTDRNFVSLGVLYSF